VNTVLHSETTGELIHESGHASEVRNLPLRRLHHKQRSKTIGSPGPETYFLLFTLMNFQSRWSQSEQYVLMGIMFVNHLLFADDICLFALVPEEPTRGRTRGTSCPVSSEISDLCEISDLLLFFSYFASQKKEIKSGNDFFDVMFEFICFSSG